MILEFVFESEISLKKIYDKKNVFGYKLLIQEQFLKKQFSKFLNSLKFF